MSNSKYNNSNANINKNSNDDESNKQDTNKLLETISLLENALNKEMNTKVIYQNENKDLTENRLPNIQNQLKLQEELLDKAMINLLIKDKESQLQPQVNRSYFREDIALKSQVDFYKNKCLTLKDELSLLKVNHDKEISKLKEQLTVEIEKNEVLINSMKDKDYQMTTLYSDVEKFSLQNNGLLEEIAILNNYISDLLYKKENQDFEIEYLRSEVSQLKSEYCYKSSQIKSNDENFNKLNILVKEYQSTLIDMEVTNYIFNVMRKGRVVDTKADVSDIDLKPTNNNIFIIILLIIVDYIAVICRLFLLKTNNTTF